MAGLTRQSKEGHNFLVAWQPWLLLAAYWLKISNVKVLEITFGQG